MNLSQYQKIWNSVLLGGECSRTQAEKLGIPVDSLGLYAGFVRRHRVHVLEKLYPLLKELVGKKTWDHLVEDYYVTHPPGVYELNQLGLKFSDFLSSRHPLWTEIARYEWLDFSVYADPQDFPEVPLSALTLNPTCREVVQEYDVAEWVREGCTFAPKKRENVLVLCRTRRNRVNVTYLSGLGRVMTQVLRNGTWGREEFLSTLSDSLGQGHEASLQKEVEQLISQQVILTGRC